LQTSKSKRTVTKSFRVSEKSIIALEEDALRHKVSLNTLVDQLFDAHANYESYVEKVGMMRMTKLAYRGILDMCPPEKVALAARQHATVSGKVNVISLFGELNLTTLLEALSRMCIYGGWGEYHENETSQGRRVITMVHDLGENGSVYLYNFVKAFFEQIQCEAKITSNEFGVVIEI
jgi:hypothetical protein